MNWKVILLSVLAVLMIPISVGAEEANHTDKFVEFVTSGGAEKRYYLVYEDSYFYRGSTGSLFASEATGIASYTKIDGEWVYQGNFHSTKYWYPNNVIDGNTPIYKDYNKSGFFFRPVTALERGVEQLHPTIMGTLVDGGLLSVGLLIFAILLGVGLVKRLVLLFRP